MTTPTSHSELCQQFAALFEYPDEMAPQTAAACARQLGELPSAAAEPMARFADFLAAQTLSRQEELFTTTFDLQPLCHPYAGYQLFGESQQRTMFLIRLQQLYREHGFSTGSELPDHLANLLRFAGSVADRECGLDIIRDGLLPALDKILRGLEEKGQPYADLIRGVQCFLSEAITAEGPALAVSGGRS